MPYGERTLEILFEHFHKIHERFYGYSISREVIELIRFSVSVTGASKLPRLKSLRKREARVKPARREVYFRNEGYIPCPVYNRDDLAPGSGLKGPAVIEEQDSTILLHPGNTMKVNSQGVITITV